MNNIEKQDFLFFYFMYIFSNNLKCMRKISALISQNKFTNLFTSIFFTYIYVILGLQAEFCMKYMQKWFKINNTPVQPQFFPSITV
jgi:hypothetical protein